MIPSVADRPVPMAVPVVAREKALEHLVKIFF
jgi:hypothetical protein